MPPAKYLLFTTIEPGVGTNRESLAHALAQLTAEDPTLAVRNDAESGKVVIQGVDELQVDIVIDRLKCEFNLAITADEFHVLYKVRLTQAAEGEARLIKQLGG